MSYNLLLNCCIKQEADEKLMENVKKVESEPKIPRPPNAFMLYANENRKILAQQFPADSNKEISRKLGSSWKSLDAEAKSRYFQQAKQIDLEHKKKYPNYVYNPKEARIRKAMREANRDRSIGASPLLPRPNARRATPHSWMPGQPEEQLMVPNLRCPPVPAGLEPCFPGIGNEPFMPMPSGAYCGGTIKMEAPLPPQASTTPGLPQGSSAVHHPSEYMTQPNPLAQLQQQTEMWPGFQEDMRPRSSNNPYILQEVQPAHHYHHQPSPPLSIPSPMAIDKHRQTPHPFHTLNDSPMPITPPHSNSNLSMTPPHSNENVPPDESPHPQTEECRGFEPKQQILESATQPLMENNTIQHQQSNDGLITVLSPGLQPTQRQAQDLKIKKVPDCPNHPFCPTNQFMRNTLYLPLSCTNFCASPDLYANNLEYQREFISKYFLNCPDYEVLNFMSEDGDTFPYATLSNFIANESILQDSPHPYFVRTNVGYVPITFDGINRNNPHIAKIRSTGTVHKK